MIIVRIALVAGMTALTCTPVLAQTVNNGASSSSNSGANSVAAGNYNNNSGNTGTSSSTSSSGSSSNSYAAGNQINFAGSKRGASSAIAPGLMASGLSCSGSAAAGGAGGGWGISLGITKEDAQCNTRENAKTVLGLTGDRDATKEVLCDIRQVRNAFRRVGRPCMADYSQTVNYANAGSQGSARRVTPTQRVTFRTMAECREYQRTHNVSCVRR